MKKHTHTSIAFGLLLVLAGTSMAQQASRRPMTTDDGLNMVNVGNALMSPDGSRVFFSKSELDWAKNKRKTTYHMIPSAGGEAYQFIGEAGGSSFAFSPDGRYLSFKRAVEKKQQLFLMRTDGGEAVQLTKHDTSIGAYKWVGDSEKIFFVANEPKTKEEEKRQKDGYDSIVVDEGPNSQKPGNWNNLWVYDLEKKDETRITKDESIIGSFDVSPDGSRIVFTARTENRRNQQNHSEIYLLTVLDGLKTQLTDNAAPESGLQWAPDGKHFGYTAVGNGDWELRESKIWVMNADSRDTRMVSGAFQGSIRGVFWTPDSKHIFFGGRQRTNANLYRLEVASGKLEQITSETGSMTPYSFSKDRTKMVYSFQDLDTPADLYVSGTSRLTPIRLTNANPWVEKELLLSSGKVIRWQSQDGLEVEGILFLPAGYREGTRIPLLVHVHGGPAGVFSNSFRASYHVWAGLGYAQLLPNVRGSGAYGDDHLRANMKDIGGGDYWDLMKGVDHAIAQGYVDEERMGIRGWSYGGILGGWTITQNNRFKGASLGAMVSDWTSEYGPGFNHDIRLWYIGGTPWENPEDYRAKSALTYVANVETPTLLLHGMNDTTDTEPQSMMFFAALKDQGKTTRYIRFPREPHGFREPRHQRTRDIEEIRWMQKHVLGEDWTPWERKVEKPEKETEKEEGLVGTQEGG